MNMFGSILFIIFLIQLSSCSDIGACAKEKDIDECIKDCEMSCELDPPSEDSCKKSCVDQGQEIRDCIGVDEGCCGQPDRSQGISHMSCNVVDGGLNGAGLVESGPGCPKNCSQCECAIENNVNVKRKKRASEKDDDPLFVKFNPLFIWHQDDIGKLVTSKKRKCCITTKRVVPFTWKIKNNIWPVFCPIDGGYQWIDQVKCDIKEADRNVYGVFGVSDNKCPQKMCQKHCTMRTYLVTNVKPAGFWGHCFYYFLPVWYRNVNVDTHCVCPYSLDSPTACK